MTKNTVPLDVYIRIRTLARELPPKEFEKTTYVMFKEAARKYRRDGVMYFVLFVAVLSTIPLAALLIKGR